MLHAVLIHSVFGKTHFVAISAPRWLSLRVASCACFRNFHLGLHPYSETFKIVWCAFLSSTGDAWRRLYQDGEELPSRSMSSLSTDRWVHVHIEASQAMDARMHLMANLAARGITFSGNLKGCLSEVYVWNQVLNGMQLRAITNGFNYRDPRLQILVAHYPMEEGKDGRIRDSMQSRPSAALYGRYSLLDV